MVRVDPGAGLLAAAEPSMHLLVIPMPSEQNWELKGAKILNAGRCEMCFLYFQPISLKWGKSSSVRRLPRSSPIMQSSLPRVRTGNSRRESTQSLKSQGTPCPVDREPSPSKSPFKIKVLLLSRHNMELW